MNLDQEDLEQELTDQAQRLLESELTGKKKDRKVSEGFKTKNKQDEKLKRNADSKTSGYWSKDETEFITKNRTKLDNEELQEFLAGEHNVNKERKWDQFSRTEEKFMRSNIQTTDKEQIAERLDRDEEEIEIQLKIMGLDHLTK